MNKNIDHKILNKTVILATLLILTFAVGCWAEPDVSVRLEAEKMDLIGYIIENNSAASKGKCVKQDLDEGIYGSASARFSGPSGFYDLKVAYFEESDGLSRYKLAIDGKWVDIWTASRDLNNDGAGKDNLVTREYQWIKIKQNDLISIYGTKDQGEFARLDYLELVSSSEQHEIKPVPKSYSTLEEPLRFNIDQQGFVRNWYRCGPVIKPYHEAKGDEKQSRIKVIANTKPLIVPPDKDQFERIIPQGEAWDLYASGRNIFVESYNFYHNLAIIDLYGLTDLIVQERLRVKARLWSTRGAVDLWNNGRHLARRVGSGTSINFYEFDLLLEPGINRIMIRELDLGARNTPQLFGLQLLTGRGKVQVSLPGDPERIKTFFEAEKWLYSINYNPAGYLEAGTPLLQSAAIRAGSEKRNWQPGQRSILLKDLTTKPFNMKVIVNLDNGALTRSIEIPGNSPLQAANFNEVAPHREEYLRLLAENLRKSENASALLIRRLFNEWKSNDSKTLEKVLAKIDSRADCSDFELAAILRFYLIGNPTEAEKSRIRKTALNFRYWSDEKGSDAMAMGSENHSILFHGNQLITGLLFPEDLFSRSGRKGKEQVLVAKERINTWFEKVERDGFTEFLSNSYVPVTMGALLNLVDYANDLEIESRASRLVDNIFRQLAEHCFDGVTSGPQGRVYRAGVLYPHRGGTQALLAYATPQVNLSLNSWVVFLAISKYRIPTDLDELIINQVEKTYPQGGTDITLTKTRNYIISSVALPPLSKGKGYIPGTNGHQEHLWEAALDGATRIFVNHPGASYEASESRPAYWNGNGILPALRQQGKIIAEIFNIPNNYPFQFTHAHWPSDQLDQAVKEGNWLFGRKGESYAALWCSGPLEASGDIVVCRELRCNDSKVSWLCIVSAKGENGDFQSFISRCRSLNPVFDKEKTVLAYGGQIQLTWEVSRKS